MGGFSLFLIVRGRLVIGGLLHTLLCKLMVYSRVTTSCTAILSMRLEVGNLKVEVCVSKIFATRLRAGTGSALRACVQERVCGRYGCATLECGCGGLR